MVCLGCSAMPAMRAMRAMQTAGKGAIMQRATSTMPSGAPCCWNGGSWSQPYPIWSKLVGDKHQGNTARLQHKTRRAYAATLACNTKHVGLTPRRSPATLGTFLRSQLASPVAFGVLAISRPAHSLNHCCYLACFGKRCWPPVWKLANTMACWQAEIPLGTVGEGSSHWLIWVLYKASPVPFSLPATSPCLLLKQTLTPPAKLHFVFFFSPN
jgi:hypothetical protein